MGRREEKIRTELNDDIRSTVKNGGKTSSFNLKKVLGSLVAIILIAAIGYGIYAILNNKQEITEDVINKYNYFAVTKEDKMGVIDTSGKTIIDFEYDYIQIPNPEKGLFICLSNYDENNNLYTSKVLNENKNEVLTNYKDINTIQNNSGTNTWRYITNILTYKENGKLGLLSTSGKKLTDAIYDSIDSLDYKSGVLKVKQDEKFGLIKLNGKKILDAKYNSIVADGYFDDTNKYGNAGYIVSIKSESGYKYGYYNSEGKEVLECKFNTVKRINEIKDDKFAYLVSYENGQVGLYKNTQNVIKNEYESIEYDNYSKEVSIEKKGKYGVYDLYGNMILPIQYDEIKFSGAIINATKDGKNLVFDANGNLKKEFNYQSIIPSSKTDKFVSVNSENKYGIMDKELDILVDNKYSYIEYAYGSYYIFSNDGKTGIMDESGKIIVENQYDVIQKISGTNIVQAIDLSNGKNELYNKSMNKVVETDIIHVYMKNNYILVLTSNKIVYLDLDGNEKDVKDLLSNNEIYADCKDGKWGYIDSKGKVVVEYKYEMATDINEYGYGAIKLNGKWGSIDSKGNIVVEPTYVLSDDYPTFIGIYYKNNNNYGEEIYSCNKK